MNNNDTQDFKGIFEEVEKNFNKEDFIKELEKYDGGSITCEMNEETGIAEVRIDHPRKKNAISGKMIVDMSKIIENLSNWKQGKGILMYGANDIFCSGGDLDFVKMTSNPIFGYKKCKMMQDTLNKLENLPMISVAYIDGKGAIGGGAELASACDYRILHPNSKIGYVHCKMGIIPAWGGTSRLLKLVGKTNALDIILSGRLMDAKDAFAVKWVNGILDSREKSLEWLKNKVKFDHTLVRAVKSITAEYYNNSSIEEIKKKERTTFAPFWGGELNKKMLAKNIKHD